MLGRFHSPGQFGLQILTSSLFNMVELKFGMFSLFLREYFINCDETELTTSHTGERVR